jgi:hypothetical protein
VASERDRAARDLGSSHDVRDGGALDGDGVPVDSRRIAGFRGVIRDDVAMISRGEREEIARRSR